jgi:hypothetical protein
MSDDEIRKRVHLQVDRFTDAYRRSRTLGYNVTRLGLPVCETQEDFDL